MKAAYRLDADEGMKRLQQQAKQLEIYYPSTAQSSRERLSETFTVNRIGLPKTLRVNLCTTNITESPYSGVRMRSRRVCNWRDGEMVLRWAASAFVETEKHFQRISSFKHLWIRKVYLDDSEAPKELAVQKRAG